VSDTWRENVRRGFFRHPPCSACGLVPPFEMCVVERHRCNPAHLQVRQFGIDACGKLAESLVTAFEVFEP
jgi:hypothetical protein